MRLTQMLAVLNWEVPKHNYPRLSHYDPTLSGSKANKETQTKANESVNGSAYYHALIEIRRRREDCPS